MRILHIYRDFAVDGGVPEQMRSVARAQASLGHEVSAICKAISKANRIDGVHIKVIPYSFKGIYKVAKEFKNSKVDAVHFSAPLIVMDLLFCLVAKVLSQKIIVSPHGVLNPLGINVRFGGKPNSRIMTSSKKIFIALAVAPLLKFVGAVHAESLYEAEVVKKYGVKRIFTVPMGVNDSWIAQPEIRLSGIRIFTYLGRLDVHHKGLDLVLDAARLLKGLGYEFKIRFVGSDICGSESWLTCRVVELDLCDRVLVDQPAWGGEKDKLFAETDFFLGVFRYAGMARACGEAISRGIPLIASREGCWGDWVEDGRIGLRVNLKTEDVFLALKRAIEMTQEEYAKMSRRAYDYSHEINWGNIGKRLVDGYLSIH